MSRMDDRLILLAPNDTVAVVRSAIPEGTRLLVSGREIKLRQAATMGHKLACAPMRRGDKVLKYGVSIGSVTEDIAVGDHVHLHNMKSDYTPTYALDESGEVA